MSSEIAFVRLLRVLEVGETLAFDHPAQGVRNCSAGPTVSRTSTPQPHMSAQATPRAPVRSRSERYHSTSRSPRWCPNHSRSPGLVNHQPQRVDGGADLKTGRWPSRRGPSTKLPPTSNTHLPTTSDFPATRLAVSHPSTSPRLVVDINPQVFWPRMPALFNHQPQPQTHTASAGNAGE